MYSQDPTGYVPTVPFQVFDDCDKSDGATQDVNDKRLRVVTECKVMLENNIEFYLRAEQVRPMVNDGTELIGRVEWDFFYSVLNAPDSQFLKNNVIADYRKFFFCKQGH